MEASGSFGISDAAKRTINLRSADFAALNDKLDALVFELRKSNEINGEIRDKLRSDLGGGKEIIAGPKPQRGLVDLLLLGPLKWLAEKSGSAVIGKLATDVLELLLKIIGG